jgi:uncharacterized protein (UPF0261 family)
MMTNTPSKRRDESMPTVVLLGTLDTKGAEYDWLRTRVVEGGCDVIVVDVGVLGSPAGAADIPRSDVATAAGTTVDALVAAGDRGAGLRAMAAGAVTVVTRLRREGAIHGVLTVAGSGGSSIAAAVMAALPVGFPKLLVSTMASGDVTPYVGASDVTLMYSVVDIAGINRLSRAILGNAAAAIAGMARRYAEDDASEGDRPLVAASMFGVTTPAVDAARALLEAAGYEVLVFHATGAGGRSLEALAAGGYLDGVLDLTTTELADELVGGVLSAGPERLTAAGRARVPQVISVGALDMVNFGPRSSVPDAFHDRLFHEHNSAVTLMRTTAEENRLLGGILAAKAAGASGPSVVLVPLRGVSALDAEGAAFRDEAADAALFEALREGLQGSAVRHVEADLHINDPEFARLAVEALLGLMATSPKKGAPV